MKHDGFRAIAYIEKRQCHLVSRNLNQFKFETLQEALSTLPAKNAILDGGVGVPLDDRGVSQFTQLLRREGDPLFCAFDLLWLNGEGYRRLPLLEKKQQLELLVNQQVRSDFVRSTCCRVRETILRRDLCSRFGRHHR